MSMNVNGNNPLSNVNYRNNNKPASSNTEENKEQENSLVNSKAVEEKDIFAYMLNTSPVRIINTVAENNQSVAVGNAIGETICSDGMAAMVAAGISAAPGKNWSAMSSAEMVSTATNILGDKRVADINQSMEVLENEI